MKELNRRGNGPIIPMDIRSRFLSPATKAAQQNPDAHNAPLTQQPDGLNHQNHNNKSYIHINSYVTPSDMKSGTKTTKYMPGLGNKAPDSPPCHPGVRGSWGVDRL